MKKSIPFLVIFRRDKNWMPKNFHSFIGFLFLAALAAILVGKFVMGYNIFF